MPSQKIKKNDVLADYKIAVESREISLIGRKEVLTGKAKFGIFGDGKEVPQLAMARAFQHGDFRSGYYRDQTFMMAIGQLTSQQFFAQLYAHPDVEKEPASAGRSMNGHFGTRSLDQSGHWKNLTKQYNSSADISPTGSQMPRLLGLAYASKIYRENKALSKKDAQNFSIKGNEVAFGTIGNASTSEGMFFETINAGGVLQVPMVVSVWDDNYGISVPSRYQTTKESISEILKGFQRDKNKKNGYEIIVVKGWDYPALINAYQKASDIARKEHVPVLIHVTELTQPQGHSTSGSHERYKSAERLKWEADFDCVKKMREWILKEKIATKKELENIEAEAIDLAKLAKNAAWAEYRELMDETKQQAAELLEQLANESQLDHISSFSKQLSKNKNAFVRDSIKLLKRALLETRSQSLSAQTEIKEFLETQTTINFNRYNSHLYSQSDLRTENIVRTDIRYAENADEVDGRLVLQACFDHWLAKDARVFAIGEDVGKIGDVNQAFAGLQEKFGEIRVTDTGIRECTIIGQGIGAALRGLRPIVEIQYLDYILYATQLLSDDLACLQYRTKGGQKAPLIIRTRGHRLEGIWHSGSPMAHIINAVHGINVLVPRNMTQAAGFYNTMLNSDEPAIIVECLNGYRLKETMPENVGEFTIPLGMPETLHTGSDVTVVSYGSTLRVIEEAMERLKECEISIELIDVQTLLPFDKSHHILESIKKTNRVIFIDEDMPAGTTAYMMNHVIDKQNAWDYLDSKPVCLSAQPNRPAYSTDGDYFSKPNAEDIFEAIYSIMNESNPSKYPKFF
jgi:pyruvate/2-oxoglutarate/acetoin dehydrogenase E1 component/TPP-dependent pyruvate/acetoin dehydrogenase alpha subunit